ncbi:hypothetical protein [Chitinimonas sp.]|uniref:hypothetical protein n=1 Tax=Chitinimonas sp. TaxID=1934313 RepID=UPI0035B22EC9
MATEARGHDPFATIHAEFARLRAERIAQIAKQHCRRFTDEQRAEAREIERRIERLCTELRNTERRMLENQLQGPPRPVSRQSRSANSLRHDTYGT